MRKMKSIVPMSILVGLAIGLYIGGKNQCCKTSNSECELSATDDSDTQSKINETSKLIQQLLVNLDSQLMVGISNTLKTKLLQKFQELSKLLV